MEQRSSRVHKLFDEPATYLHKDFHIVVRQIIIRELLGYVNSTTLLDMGCGNGSLSLQFLGRTNHVTLLDASAPMLATASRKVSPALIGNVEIVNMDMLAYCPAKQFDIVLCVGVLAHVASVSALIAKISELTRPGGRCILQLTDSSSITGRALSYFYNLQSRRRYGYSLNRTTLRQIRELAQGADLQLLQQRKYLAVLPGMGKLPNEMLLRLQLLSTKNPILSALGSELILLFRKR